MQSATAEYIRRKLAPRLCLALALLACPFFAYANPEGGVVAAGEAIITTGIDAVDIHQQSDKAIIDWRGFDIAPEERTEFHQPNAGSITLNRVHSAHASRINGRLKANGNIVIVNQNGVVFDKQAVVDVNGLLATSADIDNDRFMENKPLRFDKPANPDAAVVNHGTITAKESGLVGFVAPNVENSGVITARLGRVQLASGDTTTVDFYGDGLLEIAISDRVADQRVKNSGRIHADGGTIAMTAAAGGQVLRSSIEAGGAMRAQSVGVRGGKIIIAGASNKTQVQVAAHIDASGKLAGDRAGAVHVMGNRIAVMAGTTIDASGAQGGGEILIGGDYHGQSYRGLLPAPVAAADWGGYSALNGTADAAFFADYYAREMGLSGPPTASRVFVDRDTRLLANARVAGNGGRVILWSDHGTSYEGHADVSAGALGGNGGFIEVSGKDWLNFSGTANAGAPMGEAGMLLLDPADITISTLANSNISGASPFQNNTASASSNLNVTTLQTALGSSNVTITSAAGTGGLGDITFLDPVSWNSAFALTVTSSNNIVVNGMISNSGSGNITLTATVATTGDITINNNITTGGNITATARRDLTLAAPATLTTGATGALSLNAANSSTAGTGNLNLLGNLSVGSGNLTLLSGANGTRPSFTATTTNLVPQSNFGVISITGFNDLTIDRSLTSNSNITLNAMRDLTLNATHTITNGAASTLSLGAANGVSAGVGNLNLLGNISAGSGSLTMVSGANGTRPSFTATTTNLVPQSTFGVMSITGFNDLTIDRNLTSSGNITLTAVRDLTLNATRTITPGAAGAVALSAANGASAGVGNFNWNGIISMGTGALTTVSGANGTRPSFTLTASNLLGATMGAINIQGFNDFTIDRSISSSGNIVLYAIRDLTLNALRTLTTGAAGALDLRAASTAGTAGTGNLALNGNISMGSGAVTMRSGINGTRPNFTMTTTNFVPQGATVGAVDIQGFNDFTINRNLTSSGSITGLAFRDLIISAGRNIVTGAAGALNLQAAGGSTAGTGNLTLNGNPLSVGTGGLTLLSGINGTRPSWTADATSLVRQGATFGATSISGFLDLTIDRDINTTGASGITLYAIRDLTLNAARTLTTGATGGLDLRAASTAGTAGTGNLTLNGNISMGSGALIMRSGINGTRPNYTMTTTNFVPQGATVGAFDIQGFNDFTIDRNITSSGSVTALAFRDLVISATRTLATSAAGAMSLQAANGSTAGTGNLSILGNLSSGTGALTLISGINGTRPNWTANTTTLARLGASFGTIAISGFQDLTIDRNLNSSGNITLLSNRNMTLNAGSTVTPGAANNLSMRAANAVVGGTGNLTLLGNISAGTGTMTLLSGINGTRPDWTATSTSFAMQGATVGTLDVQGFRDLTINRDIASSGSITMIGYRDLNLNASRTLTTGAAGALNLQAAGGAFGGTGNLNLNGNLSAGTGALTLLSGINGTRPTWTADATTLVRQGATFGAINWQGFNNVTVDRPLNSSGTVSFSNNTLTTISNDISSTGAMTFSNATVIDSGVTATLTSTGNMTFSSTLNGTAGGAAENLFINTPGVVTFSAAVGGTAALGDLSVTADNVTISANMTGTGNLLMRPFTAGRTVNIGTALADNGTGAGLNFSNNEMARLVNGWSLLTFGSLTAGNVTNTRTTFSDPVTFLSGNDFINSATITTADPILVRAVRDVTLNNNITSTNITANATVLVAGRNFINNTGGAALTTGVGGRWLVYSTNPTGTTGEGTMSNAFNRYTCTYGGVCPTLGTGNGFLYSYTPTLAVTVSGQTYNYGDAVLAAGGYTILTAGYLNALDSAQGIITGAGNFGTSYVQGDNAGTSYSIVDLGSTFASNIGYGFSLSTPTGTVGQRSISITANDQNQTYGFGALNPALFSVSSGSLYGADAISGVTLTTDATTSGSGEYIYRATPWLLTPYAAVFSTGLGANYAITYLDAPTGLTINRRALTLASITAPDKVYNGLTAAALSAYTFDNPVSGDAISVTGLAGLFDSKDVGTRNVTASAGSFTGADASNYTFTLGSVATTADITARGLVITANDKTQTYGGGNSFNGFSASGLQNGETIGGVSYATNATTSTSGHWNYASSPWSITASGATGGTFTLGNYSVSYVDGALTVNRKALAVTATGINKPYDGLTHTSVTYADDRISGDLFTTSGTAAFTNPNVGVGRTINVSGIGITGTDANNYSPNATTTTTADITGSIIVPPPLPTSTEIPDSIIGVGEYRSYMLFTVEDAVYATPTVGYSLAYLPSDASRENLRYNRPVKTYVTPLSAVDEEEYLRKTKRVVSRRSPARASARSEFYRYTDI